MAPGARSSARDSTTGKARRCGPCDGRDVYFTLQDRGNVRLMRVPSVGGPPSHGRRRSRQRRRVVGGQRPDGVCVHDARRAGGPLHGRRRRISHATHVAQRGVARRAADRRRRGVSLPERRRHGDRGVPDQAAGPDTRLDASAHRDDSRRTSRPAGTGVQRPRRRSTRHRGGPR